MRSLKVKRPNTIRPMYKFHERRSREGLSPLSYQSSTKTFCPAKQRHFVGPGPWTPYFFIYFFFIFHFLFAFFFTIFLFFFYKKINHTKPNHNDWVHGHPIFPSFKVSCKEILLCCFLLATRGGRLQQWDKMSLFCGTKCFC